MASGRLRPRFCRCKRSRASARLNGSGGGKNASRRTAYAASSTYCGLASSSAEVIVPGVSCPWYPSRDSPLATKYSSVSLTMSM